MNEKVSSAILKVESQLASVPQHTSSHAARILCYKVWVWRFNYRCNQMLSDIQDSSKAFPNPAANPKCCTYMASPFPADSSSWVGILKLSKVWFGSKSHFCGTKSTLWVHQTFTAMFRSYERTWWNLKRNAHMGYKNRSLTKSCTLLVQNNLIWLCHRNF